MNGRRRRKKQALLVAQNHLFEWIVEFNGDFDLVDLAVAVVFHRAKHVSHFLIQKICRAAHLGFEEMNLRGIGLFGRPYGQGLSSSETAGAAYRL